MLDTDVMVAALRSDVGASRRLLGAALRSRYVLLLSIPLMIEYEATMTREEHLVASRTTRDDVRALLDVVAAIGRPVRLAFLWRSILRDADDDMVLETAVNGAADYLVTFSSRDFAGGASRFDVKIIRPGGMLKVLEAGQ